MYIDVYFINKTCMKLRGRACDPEAKLKVCLKRFSTRQRKYSRTKIFFNFPSLFPRCFSLRLKINEKSVETLRLSRIEKKKNLIRDIGSHARFVTCVYISCCK